MAVFSLKRRISGFLNRRALYKHHSKLGWRDAPRYTAYLKKCQRVFDKNLLEVEAYARSADEFNQTASVAIWDENLEAVANQMFSRISQWEDEGRKLWLIPEGRLHGSHQSYTGDLWGDFPELEQAYRGTFGKLLMHIYKSNYKIFYVSLAKSVGVSSVPSGSQEWHSDGGPGSCVIIAMYLHPTDQTSGCLQTLGWEQSLEIFRNERSVDQVLQERFAAENNMHVKDIDKLTRRTLRHEYYEKIISSKYQNKVSMPYGKAGTSVLFRNNTLHRGGHPELGKERYALLMHCYPAEVPTPFDLYRQDGLKKNGGYPKNPAF